MRDVEHPPPDDGPFSEEDLARLTRELPLLLSESQVAHLFSVHPKTVARWVREGSLPPPIRIGTNGQKRYGRDAVIRRLGGTGALVLAVAILAAALIALGCRLGVGIARDAARFLTGNPHGICSHHANHGRLYAAPASVEVQAPSTARVGPTLGSDQPAPTSADPIRRLDRARGPPSRVRLSRAAAVATTVSG